MKMKLLSFLLFSALFLSVSNHAYASRKVFIEEKNVYIVHPQPATEVTYVVRPQPVTTENVFVVAPQEPPTELVEVITEKPCPNCVWIPGYWSWNGQWGWVKGYWGTTPYPGAVWKPGHWSYHQHHGGWVWKEGHWH